MLDKKHIHQIQTYLISSDNEAVFTEIFKLLGEKNRYRIIKILFKEGELCVSDLSAILQISMSAISQHLRVLEMSGIILGERMGQTICYKLQFNHPKIKTILQLIK